MLEVNLAVIYQFFYFALAPVVANLMVGIGLSRSGSEATYHFLFNDGTLYGMV